MFLIQELFIASTSMNVKVKVLGSVNKIISISAVTAIL